MLTPHQKIRFRKMVDLSGVKASDKVLDIGCGNKELKEFLDPDIDYMGIDKQFNPDKIWDIEKSGLPFDTIRRKWNVIFLGEVIEHIENHKTILKDCVNCLADDGRIILSTPLAWRIQWKTDANHIHSFIPLNLRVLAGQCGLRITKMVGSFIPLFLFNLRLNVNWTFYTNNLIVRMEK